MANEKILNTRILLKTDTLEAWNSSTLPLKKGEIAIATVAATAGNGLSEPVCMIKIGEDGVKTFKDLPWNFYAKASDVIAEAKSAETLETFVNNVIAGAGIATDEAMQALTGKVTTAEGKITALEGKMTTAEGKITDAEAAIAALNELVGDTKVETQIANAIAELNLADTYAAKTHGHEIAEVNGLSDAIAAAKKAGTDANAALEAYKTLNDAAVKVNTDAIAAIKNGETLDNFKEVEEALAGKQAAGNYSVEGHKHEIADVNGLEAAIADAKKAGTDAAGAAAQALTDAKAYTDTEMTRLVGDTKVADQITTAITDLDLANTYDAKGAAAAAETAAKGHADGLNTAMNARVEALEAIDHDHANKGVLDGITAEKVAAWDAAEQNAKDHANGLNTTMDGRVAALEAKFTGEDSVADQIADAVAAEAKLRDDADKALQEQITANDGEIAALQGLVGDETVEKQIADAVKEEADRAKGIEGGLETRLAAVEGDYLKAADKTELEGKITANANAIELLTNGVSAEEVDGVNDLIQYVKDHGTEVTGIKADIKANADAIAAAAQTYETKEDATAKLAMLGATQEVEVFWGTVDTVTGSDEYGYQTEEMQFNYDLFEGMQYTVEVDDERYTLTCYRDYYKLIGDGLLNETPFVIYDRGNAGSNNHGYFRFKTPGQHSVSIVMNAFVLHDSVIPASVPTFEDVGSAKEGAINEANRYTDEEIAKLNGLVGDETVEKQITDAIEALKIGDYAKAADLTAAINQHNTDKAALEAEIAKKANDADLAAIAKTGSTDDLVQGAMTLVFDCGGASV